MNCFSFISLLLNYMYASYTYIQLFVSFCSFGIKNTTVTDRSASYLDLHLEIDSEGRLRTKFDDKRDDFNFLIVNFPFICSNIPAAPAYGVHISQLIRYSRGCGSYQDFLDRAPHCQFRGVGLGMRQTYL
jgi:hypothetical protein